MKWLTSCNKKQDFSFKPLVAKMKLGNFLIFCMLYIVFSLDKENENAVEGVGLVCKSFKANLLKYCQSSSSRPTCTTLSDPAK